MTRQIGPDAYEASLTPRELEDAQLAASGLTNREIAARLYVSPRTISSHLYRAFPKLGITSRAALRDGLDAAPSEPSADGRNPTIRRRQSDSVI